jgi:hypothetical protein
MLKLVVKLVSVMLGRAIDQAVSRWLPPRRAGFEPEYGQVGFVVDKVALGQAFSEYFDVSCQSSFQKILHPHNQPGQAGTVGQTWPTCRVEPILKTPLTMIIKKKIRHTSRICHQLKKPDIL